MMLKHIQIWLLGCLMALGAMSMSLSSSAQCEVFDYNGAAATEPYWYHCQGTDYTLNLQSPDNWVDYEINWGDGSPVESGGAWNSPTIIPHFYPATVATYTVTITEPSTGCVITGFVVMEEATSASIQIPVGGLTQACAPQEMEFSNSSTNNSENTVYTWDFGDGSGILTFDHTNWGQTVAHTYEQGTVDCETVVSLTAENFCNTIQGGASEATFNPIRIWDLDDAAITPSNFVLCYPDTTFQFENTTERNCLGQGNIFQRYEYWNFGDYWGQGQDSIIDWTPWPPTFPNEVAYPGIGTYEVQLLDSNFCGIDTANITVEIVPPPTALFDISVDTICVGEPVTFFNEHDLINDPAYNYNFQWNFGDGIGWLPTGQGNITYVYNTPGTFEVCHTITIANSGNACIDTLCMPLVVLPSPVADIGFDDLDGCGDVTVNLTDASVGATSWDWLIDGNQYTTQDPPQQFFDTAGNYPVILTVEGLNGCLATDQEMIQVFNEPTADFIATNVCEGDEAEFTDLSVTDPGDPIISWNWQFGDGEEAFSQMVTHTYATTGDFDVTLTVSTANCSSTVTYTVEVDASPVTNISASPLYGCSPLEVTFDNNTTGATNHQWTLSGGAGSNLPEPTHTFYNYGNADSTFMVTYVATTAFGCSAYDTLYVTAQPGAQALFQSNGQPPGCSPFLAIFNNQSLGADGYLWSFGDGSPTTNASNPSHLYENNTGFIQTYTVELIAYNDNGCNDTTAQELVVFPNPDFSFDLLPDSGCSPLLIQFPFIAGAQLFEWDFGDGSPISNVPVPLHLYENNTLDPVTYDVTLIATSPFGCVDTSYSTVLVQPSPQSYFETDINNGCSPLTVEFENLAEDADLFTWVYDDGDTSYTADPFHTHTFVNLGPDVETFVVTLFAETVDGCVHAYSTGIEVYPEVEAAFDPPPAGCGPYLVEFENQSVNADGYVWTLGNGVSTTTDNPSSIFPNQTGADTTYSACLFAENLYGCTDQICHDVVVHSTAIADFEMSSPDGCSIAPIELTNTSQLGIDFQWIYGDGDSQFLNDPVHTHEFDNPSGLLTQFDIQLVAYTGLGCSDTVSQTVNIYPEVHASFLADTVGCSPLEVDFTNTSVNANAGFEWDFGNGLNSQSDEPTTIYFNNTLENEVFTAQLIATSVYGCVDTTYQDFLVYHLPDIDAEIASMEGCYPLEVTFDNLSDGADSFQWLYGTGETSTMADPQHTHTYFNLASEPINYTVTLNGFTDEGCMAQDQLTVQVLPELEAAFDAPTPGCAPFEVSFLNQSTGATNFAWDFGDGTTHAISEPSHLFTTTLEEEVFTVTLVAFSGFGCVDSTSMDITVYQSPSAGFTALPESQIFPDATVDINDFSDGENLSYNWFFGDGAQSQDSALTSHSYDSWGVYNITLVVDNGACEDEFTQTVEILAPPPIANFEGPAAGCVPLTVQFSDSSLYAAQYQWNFGDGGSASVSNPIYTFYQPGTYTVSLEVTGYDGAQTDIMVREQIIEVYPKAMAAFTVSPVEVTIPMELTNMINLSEYATSYEWDFGDGTSSTEENPSHQYYNVGSYDITLYAFNEFNCIDSFTVVNAVNAIDFGDIVFPNAFTPNETGPTDGSYDPQATDNNIFFPLHKGVVDYELQIFNRWGELLFESTDVFVGWDGYYRNELSKPDVYVWKATVTFSDGKKITQAGDLTLLK